MSLRRSQKRRRSQVFSDGGDDASSALLEDGAREGGNDERHEDKRQEVWDSVREEHYEVVEQLPLTLHRHFTLMHELDEQAHGYASSLLPTIKQYVIQRKAAVAYNGNTCHSEDPNHVQDSYPPKVLAADSGRTSHTNDQAQSVSLTRTPTPFSIPPDREQLPQTTRGLLSHTALLSQELLRASEEKVNLAQAACDSVERHIRLIDQAIEEQKALIALGSRSGTYLAPILLPESRRHRSYRGTLSPPPSDPEYEDFLESGNLTGAIQLVDTGSPILSIIPNGDPNIQSRTRTKLKKKAEINLVVESVRRETRSLKIMVPPIPPNNFQNDAIADGADERRYCHCNEPSYGEMIACDNPACEIEWFHLNCVGLAEAPKGNRKWYCEKCSRTRKKIR